ncbi:DUF3656 domain-containing U32 family peptidase [Clostridium cylindrosporum]|uniref:Protease n=1 Tax=Clostridium cylindrosporum DSM 605 TaxID=1121307 RepID=A0A0J8D9Y2_CLOCY|nr:U32 family peptidase [Clostridium cylindrosporum]KMT22652.1 protease [Clostridium cylindrosporum DSM 605]
MSEILAPAGNFECLKAAVLNGADAVYVGGSEFSARKYASNFSREEMIEAVRYCHSYNVKLYVTMNTLLSNKEIQGALEYAAFLYEVGVDAIIVQDIGFLKLLRDKLPELEVHGSTQMTVHNLEGVNLLYNMGVKRVVLSRELSIEEIKYIKENTKAEIEVFVHGALCICFSGQCLFSSMIGGRSGNRGTCAQSCRMEYSLDGGKKSHILSPKDLSTLEYIEKLVEIGVDSLKIEGRMKRFEYVATVVSSYKKAIEGRRESKDIKNVTQIFNRGGFTSAFMHKNEGKNMMSYDRPKNWGTYLGDVIGAKGKFCDIRLVSELNLEDGVEVFGKDKGAKVSKIKKGNIEVESASKGDIVTIYLEGAKAGDKIYKSSDILLLKSAKETIDPKSSPKRGIRGEFIAKIGEEPILTVRIDSGNVYKEGKIFRKSLENFEEILVNVTSDISERAINKPTTKEKVEESLRKLGDTPFEFESLNVDIEEGIIIPVSRLNAMRREVIDSLIDKLQGKKEKLGVNIEYNKKPSSDNKRLVVCTTDIKSAKEAHNEGVDLVFYGGENLRFNPTKIREIAKLNNEGIKIYPWFSEIVLEELDKVKEDIAYLKENGVDKALCSNLGVYSILKESGYDVFLDKGFNVFNSKACETFESEGVLLSPELNVKQLRDTVSKTEIKTMIHIHGRQKLMVSRHCPVGSFKGDGTKTCSTLCENRIHYMKDRMGEDFPIYTDLLCRSHIYNSKTLCTIESLRDIISINVDYLMISFLDEDIEEVKATIKAYRDAIERGQNGDFSISKSQEEVISKLNGKATKGHFYKGVI